MDLAALAAKHRAESAAAGPADVKNVRPSLRNFEHYVSTKRNELAVLGELRRLDPDHGPAAVVPASVEAFVTSLEGAGCYGTVVGAESIWGGSLLDVRAADGVAKMPILGRSIVLDEQDLYRLRNAGADAAVVYAALHDAARLSSLRRAARSMHMEILVEVTDDASLEVALASDCTLIGIPGSDLAAAARRLARIPSSRVPILVGGIRTPADLGDLLAAIDALILVEPLATADPGAVAEPFTTLV